MRFSYHQRQVTFCVNAPPINGPTTEATAKVADSELVIAGLIRGLEDREMMIKHPARVPAQPVPVTARPAMKALLFGASAQIDYQTAHLKDEDAQEVTAKWEKLVGRADEQVLRLFVMLRNPPKHYHKYEPRTPYRLYHTMAPVHDDSILFMNHVVAGAKLFAPIMPADLGKVWHEYLARQTKG